MLALGDTDRWSETTCLRGDLLKDRSPRDRSSRAGWHETDWRAALRTLAGIAASPGFAVGPAYRYLPGPPVVHRMVVQDREREQGRLKDAIGRVDRDLADLMARLEKQVGREQASIFEAHRLFLVDSAFVGRAWALISAERVNAEWAVDTVMNELRATFEAMDDEYFRARSADVGDVGHRLIRTLSGIPQPTLTAMVEPCIVVARDLMPSDTAGMDRDMVLGVCTAEGGRTAHAAILARAQGIPAIVGAGEEVVGISHGCMLALDGEAGIVVVAPDDRTVREFSRLRSGHVERQKAALHLALEPAITLDGHRVEVVANIGSAAETENIVRSGGEGVGLLRTEFLFLDRTSAPSEDEQAAVYREIGQALNPRPVIIRTLDIGGDKRLPYLTISREDNPFLGHRGVRLCLAEAEMFKTQLRAILRAAHGTNLRVMFPMVATVGEVRAARARLAEARAELDARGVPYGTPDVGIMIETPAAAILADVLASEVDFFSVGTNDLAQYTLAADRTNALVQGIADAMHPSVLRLIAGIIDHAHQAGIWVGLCGELAADPLAIPVLLGLGLDEFSAAPVSLPALKEAVRAWSLAEAKALAREVLTLESAECVRERVKASRH